MRVILDMHQRYLLADSAGPDNENNMQQYRELYDASAKLFHLGIGANDDFMFMGTTALAIQPGFRLEISVDVKVHQVTDGFKKLDIADRYQFITQHMAV